VPNTSSCTARDGLVGRPWARRLEVKTTRFDLMCAPVRVSWVRGPDC